MLNDADIAWMKVTREEVVKGRQTLITIAYESAGAEDEFTGEIIPGTRDTSDVMSVVTEISSMTGTGVERIINSGIATKDGDIWLSINFDLIDQIHDKITEIHYGGEWYSVLASDKKGIGGFNRVEFLGRLIT